VSTVIVCRADTIAVRRVAYCPTCERRRRFAAQMAPYVPVAAEDVELPDLKTAAAADAPATTAQTPNPSERN
jgi:hypothetical protein